MSSRNKYDIDFTSTTAKIPRVDMVIHGAFSSGIFNIAWISFAYYLVYFYTDILGISAAVAGVIALGARLFDVATDLILGYLMDNKCLKWGRYRSWLILGLPILVLTFVGTFTSLGDASTSVKVLWASVTYGLYGAVGATLVFLPSIPQLNNMTKNPSERALFASFKGVFNACASIAGASFFIKMVDIFGKNQGNEARGFFVAAVVIAILMGAFVLGAIIVTKKYELNEDGSLREHLAPSGEHVSLVEQVKELVTNIPAVLMMSGQFCYQIMIAIRNGMMIYIFSYYWGLEGFNATAVLANSLAMVGGALLLKPVIKLFGDSNRAFKIAILGDAVCAILLFFAITTMGPGASAASIQFGALFILFVINGMFLGLHNSFQNVLLPAVIDYGEWRTGRNQSGMVASMYGLSITLGSAIGGFLLGVLLEASGYVANAEQSEGTLKFMLVLMFLVPAGLSILHFILQSFYKLNDKKMTQYLHEVAERRKQAAAGESKSAAE